MTIYRLKKSTTTAAAATSAATAATTANGDGGGDGETGTHAGLHEINFDISATLHQLIVNKKGDIFMLYLFVILFWLIQSQSQ